jgi:hypothetical protein
MHLIQITGVALIIIGIFQLIIESKLVSQDTKDDIFDMMCEYMPENHETYMNVEFFMFMCLFLNTTCIVILTVIHNILRKIEPRSYFPMIIKIDNMLHLITCYLSVVIIFLMIPIKSFKLYECYNSSKDDFEYLRSYDMSVLMYSFLVILFASIV